MATLFNRGKSGEGKMSLGRHLIELRNRLYISAGGVLVATIGGWFLSAIILDAISEPIEQIAIQYGRVSSFNFGAITTGFDLRFQIAITVGILLASPLWLYQIWAFLMPGLNKKEKQYGLGFMLTAIPLFFVGAYAGWFVFPNIVALLTSFVPEGASNIMDARMYYDFALKLIIIVGVAFVLPVFLVLLNFVGVLSAASILKSWRVAILVIILFTATATPSVDVISMFMLAVPMILLYFSAAFIAWLHDRRVAKRAAAFDDNLGIGESV